ncbi:hypothetical protein [Paenalcaligenes suwonensis]|uniref:hypothetical protein n=1 Tax=Paenalcaligenes suwonensis TaxID=1202713 RepID=UPI00140DC941|nr:hypothetical protein [Paenalcaligenes suwonensis]NHC62998.1 hypothetical protein [Paenalcaligenes suwonensis]
MPIAILVVLVCGALLVAPMLLSASVAVVAVVLWKSGRARMAMQMLFVVAVAVLTYWLATLTALMLVTYETYVVVMALSALVVVISVLSWIAFRALFRPR